MPTGWPLSSSDAQMVGGCALDHQAASATHRGHFETELLTIQDNISALADMQGRWIDRHHAVRLLPWIALDMDSSVSSTHGAREGTAWNSHFACTCHHSVFVFNQFGHLKRRKLRPGNVHSVNGWAGVLQPVMARDADKDILRDNVGILSQKQFKKACSATRSHSCTVMACPS